MRSGAAVVAATLVAITVLMLIVPLPTWLLDGLIGINLGLSIALLATALLQRSVLELSALPTVLVLLTVFRLALNVSSVRLILVQADAGRIIRAFGSFVVRGDAFVGLALFGLLALVQLLVISRGGERVAEVAARFALDAMPGRGAAIDGELRLGVIDAEEARRRRAALMQEAQLYGSLDGAMRFVRGDAIASISVLAVSLLGGLAVGVLRRGLSIADASRLYTLLTVGDGLVTQVPSLIVATAASLVVTRASAGDEDDGSVGQALLMQLGKPRALAAAAVVLFLLALMPGLPLVPFVAVGAVFVAGAFFTGRVRPARPTMVYPPETVAIEVAIDPALAGQLLALTDDAFRATARVADELGLPLPAPRVAIDARLPLRGFEVRLRGAVLFQAVLPSDRVFVDCPPARLPATVEGEATDDPLTGASASFVSLDAVPSVRAAGLTVRSAEETIALRLEGVLRRSAPELLGFSDVQRLVDRLRLTDAALVREVVPGKLSLTELTTILRRLVGESVSIGNLRAILEQLAQDSSSVRGEEPGSVVERIRGGLRRQLSARYAVDRRIEALILDGDAEEAVRGAVRESAGTKVLTLEPALSEALLDSLRSELGSQPGAVLLAPRELRRHVRRLFEGEFPRLPVLAYDELQPDVMIERVGTLRVS